MSTHGWSVSVAAVLLACAACSGNNEAPANAPAHSKASVSLTATTTPEQAHDNLPDRVQQLLEESEKLPREEFDPAALAAKLGKNPQEHFKWVRDHTWWAPYRGLLRGPQGVMLDRVGSSLDRATLLGDLLRHSGHRVRLRHAQLTDARARELLETLRPMRAAAPRAPAGDVSLEASELAGSLGNALLAAIEAAKIERSPTQTSLAALRDHWWVEREENGEWIAMDVLLPDREAGAEATTAIATSEWDVSRAFPSIPDSEWHSVAMSVVVERFDAGATTEFVVLDAVIRPAEVLGKRVQLTHAPVPWPADLPAPDDNPQAFRDAALAVNMWMPVLHVGDELIMQSGFTSEGDLHDDLAVSLADIGKLGAGQIASGMDMALGGFGAEESVPAATAEWIDYEIRTPGLPTAKLRRPVFDLLGPARRQAKSTDFDGAAELRKLERFDALWSQTEILLLSCELTGSFLSNLAVDGVVRNQQELLKLGQETDPVKTRESASRLLGRVETPQALPTLALWRASLNPRAGDTFMDRTIVLHHRIGRSALDSERRLIRQQVDVAFNPVGIRHGADSDAFEARLRQGVADTVSEVLALGGDLQTSANVASIFGRLAKQNSRGILILPRDQAAAQSLPWPDDEVARVVSDVNAGYIVMVPRQAVVVDDRERVGWWRVDPVSGETVGVMDDGFHGMTETKLKILLIAAAPILANPQNVQRADRVRQALARPGYAIPLPDVRLARIWELSRHLAEDLAYLAKKPP